VANAGRGSGRQCDRDAMRCDCEKIVASWVGIKPPFAALRDWIPFSNKEGNREHPELCVTNVKLCFYMQQNSICAI
jgi:hypothetical protein